ncbi:hypothetical protein BDP27DRAFT_1371681 [Rhodocollybia butyracea]|uniref:Uncharacterized protein n=1 Tax=Rhodocollybia butyracea TaxID=206335 RepID=A0A9P5P6N8_9AGAR|nr:hypothetical protein BDP27DRAFT_1371681 [Rhodocollybia butyracea]
MSSSRSRYLYNINFYLPSLPEVPQTPLHPKPANHFYGRSSVSIILLLCHKHTAKPWLAASPVDELRYADAAEDKQSVCEDELECRVFVGGCAAFVGEGRTFPVLPLARRQCDMYPRGARSLEGQWAAHNTTLPSGKIMKQAKKGWEREKENDPSLIFQGGYRYHDLNLCELVAR